MLIEVFGPRETNAVLGGKRSRKTTTQIRNLVGHLAELRHTLRAVQIEDRAHVKLTRGRVTIKRCFEIERPEDLPQTGRIVG